MTLETREMVFDVVVVGGGGAGLLAAAEAGRLGRTVCVLEKASTLGGTTAMSVGSIMAAGTRLQRQDGIVDTPAEHARDLATICAQLGLHDNAELRDLYTSHAAEAVDLLESIGVVFTQPMVQPPHGKPRLHQVIPGSRSYIHHLERYCRRHAVALMPGTQASSLVYRQGSVLGVKAHDSTGEMVVTARRAVVLASGDVAGDAKLLRTYVTTGLEDVTPINPDCAGDGHRMAAAVGAHIVPRSDFSAASLTHIRFLPPAKKNFVQRIPPYALLARLAKLAISKAPPALIRPFVLQFLTTALAPDRGVFQNGALLVNLNGQRFANELSGPGVNDVGRHDHKVAESGDENTAPSLLLARQPNGLGYLVFDHRLATLFSKWPHFISTAPGVAYAYLDDYRKARPDLFHTAQTLEGLSEILHMPPCSLHKTAVEANNQRANHQLIQAPFYALGPVTAWILVTPVGLKVDGRLRVLREDGSPIAGLFAAGGAGQGGFTVTGHGHGLGWAFTSGMLAGRNAAQRDET
ncbi:FAD-dependent oxidoreductase [Pusillimonas sp.]|uniref:FAD-dependent oxidoreductase n=1 Tax=Pusillimonas sp. TaxID=3040095 RepID=UPI0029B5EB22|nr:FAD-dependent oxidoreductase [Pusillimonas sp.]MDX3895454.1 FAD-dependent oxidoreductase [Pusillimonas sp.]